MSGPTVSPFHLLHRWSRWSKPESITEDGGLCVSHTPGEFTYATGVTLTNPGFTYEIQRRECVTCGAEQTRRSR